MRFLRLAAVAWWCLTSLPGVLAQQGEWNVIGDSHVVCIHSVQLPNGKLLCIERPREEPYSFNNNSNGRTVAELNIQGQSVDGGATYVETLYHKESPSTYANSFCGGHSILGNGSVLIVGGDPRELVRARNGTILIKDDRLTAADLATADPFLDNGNQAVRLFNPCQPGDAACDVGTWYRLPDMSSQRWYPTVATLADGTAIIIGGSLIHIDMGKVANNSNPTYEYFPPRAGNWPAKLDILSWAYPHSLYPIVFTMPSGKVFVFVSNRTSVIDPEADKNGAVLPSQLPDMDFPGHAPWIYPHTPSAVVLPMTINNKWKFTIQVCGGSMTKTTVRGWNWSPTGQTGLTDGGDARTETSADCMVISPEEPKPAWAKGPIMPRGRLMGDNVLLPDGTILYTNGAAWGQAGGDAGQVQYASPPIFATDLYDPETSTWQTLANSTVPRLYHSNALLMPSGHVITVGSEMNNWEDYWIRNDTTCFPFVKRACTLPFERKIEQFTPPYLMKGGERPVIDSVPTAVTYNSTYAIKMKTDGTAIHRVTITRYAATTHQINTDQRLVELVILGTTKDTIYLRAPSSGGMAPPGYWMLWALDGRGVPGVARTFMLRIGDVTNVVVPDGVGGGNAGGTGTRARSGAGKRVGGAVGLGVAALIAVVLRY
ncbi:hypothetical protein HDV00_004518 [Rhizophlyctis rosea]|nr:hypothetical protein HDV00_004518 [Rhizophlyctis rosea]